MNGFLHNQDFIFFVAALIGVYLAWSWLKFEHLRTEIRTDKAKYKGVLTDGDWWIVEGLRKRAHDLRIRADLSLASAFTLLFAGIYLVLFILPLVPGKDKSLADQLREESFKNQSSNIFESLVKGTYWIKLPEESLNEHKDAIKPVFDTNGSGRKVVPFTNTSSIIMSDDDNWSISDLALTPTERVTALGLSADGSTALIAGHEGSFFMKTNKDEKWNKLEFELAPNEWVNTVAFSADGSTALIAGDESSVFMKTNKDEKWNRPEIELAPTEWVNAVALSADGSTALIAGDEGSVFMKTNKDEKWHRPKFGLAFPEIVTALGLSADGSTALIAGHEGSVFMKTNKDEKWHRLEFELAPNEWVNTVAFSADGSTALIAGNKGSVFMKANKDEKWNRPEFGLAPNERVNTVVFSADGSTALIAGHEGSVFMKTNKDEKWNRPEFELAFAERVTALGLSADGSTALIAGDEGSVFMKTNEDEKWHRLEFELAPNERVNAVAFSADGSTALIAGDESSVFIKVNSGENWKKPLQTAVERVTTSVSSTDNDTTLVAGDNGSVLMRTNAAEKWNKLNFKLEPDEEVVGVVLSTDGKTGLIIGHLDSVILITDAGENWKPTKLENKNPQITISYVGESFEKNTYVAKTDSDEYYLLSAFPELAEWKEMSLDDIHNIMIDNNTLSNSAFFSDLTDVVIDISMPDGGKNYFDEENGSKGIIINEVTVMRAVTIAVLFFLVQILVRLYQYSLRLAAFWDSRADALLLSESYSDKKTKRFDNLIGALAPDAYDFKPPRESPFSWLLPKKS